MFIPPLMTLLAGPSPAPLFDFTRLVSADWITALGPSAIHVASLNKTFVAWYSVGNSGYKSSLIAAYDHTTKTWSERVKLGNYLLPDDDHGAVSLCRDTSGYIYAFFGAHATTLPWSVTNVPDDIAGWTPQTPLSVDQTGPRPVLVGSKIWILTHNATVLSRRVQSIRSGTPSGGSVTFSGLTDLVDFGASTRTIRGEAYAVSTDIHFVMAKMDSNDVARTGVYYFVYDTVTGALKNHDASVSTASGSLPVLATAANASYRIFAHGVGAAGEVPSFCFDTAGDPHVLFADDSATATLQLKHIKRTSGTWSSPVVVDTIFDVLPGPATGTGFNTTFTAVAGASGTIEAWYINAAGDKIRKVRSSSGVWSSAETIAVAGAYKLINNQAVFQAHADMRSIYSEAAPYPASDAGAIFAKRYAHGDSGPILAAVPTAIIDPLYANVSALMSFDHRDNTRLFINEAETGFEITTTNTAQSDTAQSKFGGSSLLIPNNTSFLSLPNNALFSVSQGDFCVEGWIRLNSVGKIHCLASKRPAAGTAEWNALVLATNALGWQGYAAGGIVLNIAGTTVLTTGVWYHVAYTRTGTTWRCFLNGALEASGTQTGAPTSNSQAVRIGGNAPAAAHFLDGWIDEFRFTSGSGRYTAAFTAPVAAFPRR